MQDRETFHFYVQTTKALIRENEQNEGFAKLCNELEKAKPNQMKPVPPRFGEGFFLTNSPIYAIISTEYGTATGQ